MIHLIDRSGKVEATWVENQTSEAYHQDKTAVSSSALRKMLKSPATFRSYFIEAAHEESESFKFGSAFHMALLEPNLFFKKFVRMPEFVGKTKDGRDSTRSAKAQEMKAEWLESQPKDAVILTEENYLRLEGMLNSVLKHPHAKKLLLHGQAELSGFYSDPETGLKCKIRPDFLNWEMMSLVDVKTTQDCSREGFQRSIREYRYDIQMAMYVAGIQQISARETFHAVFLAVEKTPPYEVALYEVGPHTMQIGKQGYRKCLDQLSDCLHTNKWPAYQSSLEQIEMSDWAIKELI